jgi:hypothetical protein
VHHEGDAHLSTRENVAAKNGLLFNDLDLHDSEDSIPPNTPKNTVGKNGLAHFELRRFCFCFSDFSTVFDP